MAFVEGNFVKIPPVSTNIPFNPLLGYEGSQTAPPSSTSDSVSQSTLAHRILLRDQRCLVTGAISSQIQASHLINTVRAKPGQAEKLAVKANVERILTRQRFGAGDFHLDSLPNCIALESQFHGDLDTYGSFCISPPLDQLWQIEAEMIKINRDWDNRAQSDLRAARNLDVYKAPFVVEKYALLVLRPDLFLPDNRPLYINRDRTLRNPGSQLPPQSQGSSWVSHRPKTGTPYLTDLSGDSVQEFEFKSLRRKDDLLSVFSLIVNANSKFQQFHGRPPMGTLTSYMKSLEALVKAIFYVPEGILGTSSSTAQPAHPSAPALTPRPQSGGGPSTQPTTDPSPESGRDVDVPQGQHPMDLEDQEANATEDLSNPDIDLVEFDDDSEGDGPDTVNGLTFLEMEIVMNRVSDGRISDAERAEAAMLMLGMAGGHRRPQALSPLIRDDA